MLLKKLFDYKENIKMTKTSEIMNCNNLANVTGGENRVTPGRIINHVYCPGCGKEMSLVSTSAQRAPDGTMMPVMTFRCSECGREVIKGSRS